VRPDNLDALPFADIADQDPDALPFGTSCPCGSTHDRIPCAAGCERGYVETHGEFCWRCRQDMAVG
jgi:hypothetical protein